MPEQTTDRVGPVDHITRAVLPWRTTADLTECGKPVTELVGRLVTRDEARARINRLGQMRAAYTLCMTCATTSDRHRNRIDDVVSTVERQLGWVAHAYPTQRGGNVSLRWVERQRIAGELEAIAALVAKHREEFDAYLTDRGETVSLADRRRERRGRVSGG